MTKQNNTTNLWMWSWVPLMVFPSLSKVNLFSHERPKDTYSAVAAMVSWYTYM